jgi:shikimate kinase
MHLILCGMPKCGKTTFGKLTAERCKLPFIDTDSWIESAYAEKKETHYSCREIFQQKGEKYFRNLENEQLWKLKTHEQSVVAIGGGSLLDARNVDLLQTVGRLIYLKMPLLELWKRMEGSPLPAYLNPADPEQSFYQLAEKRLPLYEKIAHVTIDCGNQDQLLEKIINASFHG